MSGIFTHTPLSDALGGSFKDLGGAGDQPANLMQGLSLNGIQQTASPAAPVQDSGFDAVLKAPTVAPQPFKFGG
jgi:hypothetical protein